MTETPACSHQYWHCRQYNSDVILHYHRLREWNSLYDCYFLSNSQLQLGCCIILLISSYDWKKVFNPVSRTFSILFPMLHCALSTLRFVILRTSTCIFEGPHFQSCHLSFICNCITFRLSCCTSIFLLLVLCNFSLAIIFMDLWLQKVVLSLWWVLMESDCH